MDQDLSYKQQKQEKITNWRSELLDLIKTLIIVLVIYFVIKSYIAQPFLVRGRSMEQTLSDGDYLIVDQLSYNISNPKRSDIVVFHTEFIQGGAEKEYYIKRIIGIPGDRVVIKDGNVILYKNNSDTPTLLKETYIIEGLKTISQDPIDVTLSENQYFVLGDNRGNSSDSRYWGVLNKQYIIGKPVIRLFPFNAIKIFSNNIE
jgi:signal peptidase I